MNKLDDKFKNAGLGEKIKKKRKTMKIIFWEELMNTNRS